MSTLLACAHDSRGKAGVAMFRSVVEIMFGGGDARSERLTRKGQRRSRVVVAVVAVLCAAVVSLAGPASTWAAELPGTQVDLSSLSSTYTISGDGTYSFYGSGTHGINVTGGSPTIVLSNASINVSSGNAINITGGSPTIKVEGNNTVQCSGSSNGTEGAGIYVAQGSSVIITADDRSSTLTARTERDGAGIGGYYNGNNYTSVPCGDITITNVTVYAYSACQSSVFPGIGAYETSGSITIDNATVYAYGSAQLVECAPAIGCCNSVPTIHILHGSIIYAYRGSDNNTYNADYIGQGGGFTYSGGQIQTGTGGSITNSTIHMGDYSNNTPSSTTEWPYDTPDSTAFPITITSTTGATATVGYITGPTLSVTAVGDGLTYQWYKNSVSYANQIGGATSASYQVPTGLEVDTYTYKCVVKSGNYTLASDPITFKVKNGQTATEPTRSAVTPNSITINSVGGQMYAITTENTAPAINAEKTWVEATGNICEFTGLNAGTTYYIWTYAPETDTQSASEVVGPLTVTTDKNDASFGTLTVTNNGEETDTFTYGDTITVSGKIAASATVPSASNGICLLAEPEQNQVALFLGDTQLAESVTVSNNTFSISYNTALKQIPTGSQTLTVKYGGSSDLNSGETTATITLNQKTVTASLGGTTAKTYDGETNAPEGLTVGLSGVLPADAVTVSAESITYDDANAGANKTITATGITLSGDDAKWYSLSSDTATTTGSITAAASSVASAPTVVASLAYTGGGQLLVTAGEANNGTMVYALGSDVITAPTSNYNKDIPTGTNAGTYYVWYKVQGDRNYNDTDPECVTVTIAKATPELSLAASPASLRGRGTVTLTLTGVPEDGGRVTVACDDGGITVAAGDDGAWTASLPNRTQTYTFTASFDGSGNYDPAKASCTVEVTYRSTYVPPAHEDGPSTSGSEGWDDIRDEIADAEDGGSIVIDMGGETEVPGELFEEVAGKDVDVTFELENGVSWTVNGKDVPKGADIGDLDLGVDMGTDGIPVDVINAVTGEVGTVQITLAHDGEFGFEMVLTAPLGRENAGYWANLYHYDEDGERLVFETDAQINGDGDVSLRLSHASQYAIVIDEVGHALPFADTSEGEWYSEPVRWAWLHGVMTGYDDGSNLFGTKDALTRAQLAATLYKAAGSPAADAGDVDRYSDCEPGAWYAEAVAWATDQGLMTGYDDGSGRFAPDAPLTREQLVVVFWRAAGSPGSEADLGAFPDGGETSLWARPAVMWAVSTGLLKGYDDTGELDPAGTLTRAQAATVLYRLAAEGAGGDLGIL